MIRFLSLLVVSTICLIPSFLVAVTIRVPGDQATIQAGIDAATGGDTVLVAPGRYFVNLDFHGKNIFLGAEGGPLVTFLEPFDRLEAIVKFASGETAATLTGFSLCGTAFDPAVEIVGSSPTIIGNRFSLNSGGHGGDAIIFVSGAAHPLIKQNLFWNNPNAYLVIWSDVETITTFLNNTIHSGRQGLYVHGAGCVVRNNIVTGCDMGMSISNALQRYNNAWGNGDDWIFGSPDPTDISIDPQFADTARGIYGLKPGSGCVNAGDPTAGYNDPDGSRSDIGAFYFDLRNPSVSNLNPGYADPFHVTDLNPTFYWSYFESGTPLQLAFGIEIGTDRDWSAAEIWSADSVASTDTSTSFTGTPLAKQTTYYYRVRVRNAVQWSVWKESAFHTNGSPSAPVPDWPVGGEQACIHAVDLRVWNGTDPENDNLSYDYEIYSDPGLAVLVDNHIGRPQLTGKSNSGLFTGLIPGTQYWWRCRAYDDLEYSGWSVTETFAARNPLAATVPGQHATIQAGIDAVQRGDTVLVAPGTYTGDGNRDLDFGGKNLILKADQGATVTIIDCQAGPMDAHWGIRLHSGEDSSSVIDGFTITNAFTDELGAVYLTSASPTIRNCIITQNECNGVYCASSAKPIIDSCIISENSLNGVNTGFMLAGGVRMSNSLIVKNGLSGVTAYPWPGSRLSNCTIVGNGQHGIYLEGEPPLKAEQSFTDSTVITNCVVAFNGHYGFLKSCCWYPNVVIKCTDAFGNNSGDWHYTGAGDGDTLGNISQNPQFCDTSLGNFRIMESSPCAPANNVCSVLLGAFAVGCEFMCGDANANRLANIQDVTYLINFLYRNGPAPVPYDAGNVNGIAGINIQDVTYLLNYLYRDGPPLNCP